MNHWQRELNEIKVKRLATFGTLVDEFPELILPINYFYEQSNLDGFFCFWPKYETQLPVLLNNPPAYVTMPKSVSDKMIVSLKQMLAECELRKENEKN